MEDSRFDDTLRLAGWLLAHQVHALGKGGAPMPLICFFSEDLEGPQLIAPKGGSGGFEDGGFEDHVSAGRAFLSYQSEEWAHWGFAYDEALAPSGRALLVEMGGQGFGDPLTLVQCYLPVAGRIPRFLGDFDLVGWEHLPAPRRQALQARNWRYLVTEGATHHGEVGLDWLTWYAARDPEPAELRFEEVRRLVRSRKAAGELREAGFPWKTLGATIR